MKSKNSKIIQLENVEKRIDKILDNLIPILIQVESGGKDQAVGDNGKAKGPLQIWDIYIKDVNNFYKTNYSHDDAFNRIKAIDITKKYLKYWGKYYTKTTGKFVNMEILSRIHNGGPKGYLNSNTDKYWNKVKSYLFI